MGLKRFYSALEVVGLGLIGAGLGLVWFPLALIWFGLALILISARLNMQARR